MFKRILLTIICVTFVAGDALAVSFSLHGYYRNKPQFYYDLDAQKGRSDQQWSNSRVSLVAFDQMRLRLEPAIKVNDFISIQTQFDIFDNVLFGNNQTVQKTIASPIVGTVTLPAGNGSISMVGGTAGENGAINIRRAYVDILLPVGKLRMGRVPSNWGLGIFQNDGNDLQSDFGDSADRIMFMTQYDLGGDSGSIFGGVLWDIAYEAQRDPRIGGLAEAIRSNGQDTNQWAAFMVYDQENASVGVFGGVRKRNGGSGTTTVAEDAFGNEVASGIDGDTLMWFGDLYARYSYGDYNFKLEYVHLGGSISTGVAINAVPFAVYTGDPEGAGIIQLPKQSMAINLAAFEADARYDWGGDWNFKGGFAQGDKNVLSTRITEYGFRPDYQIALLMFREPLGTSPQLCGAASRSDLPSCGSAGSSKLLGGVPITGNFINNAIYVSAGYKHHFNVERMKNANDMYLGAQITTAWAQVDPVNMDFPAITGNDILPVVRNNQKWYGVEADIGYGLEFFDMLKGYFDAGILIPGGAYNIHVDQNLLGTQIDPIPDDKAELIYGARFTLAVLF